MQCAGHLASTSQPSASPSTMRSRQFPSVRSPVPTRGLQSILRQQPHIPEVQLAVDTPPATGHDRLERAETNESLDEGFLDVHDPLQAHLVSGPLLRSSPR